MAGLFITDGDDKPTKRDRARRPSNQSSHFAGIALPLTIAAAVMLSLGIVLASALIPEATSLTNEDFGIDEYLSPVDTDGDGIDDQTDILDSAKRYVATEPRYASTYFEGGHPTDGTGVCTDVVAEALLGAGYDLQVAVDRDIRDNPELYDVGKVDPNIDYRRVRNLRVWFPRHATVLTTDVRDIAKWQGGDIVCYDDHIGIVSDQRNARGIPYIIHNGSPWQRSYEENRLDRMGEIVGHWRMS